MTTFPTDWAEILVDEIDWEPVTGQGEWGRETYGSVQTFKARIEHTSRMVRTPAGETVLPRGKIMVGGTPMIGVDDRITLRPSFGGPLAGTQPSILDVQVVREFDGTPYYTRVMFA